MKSFLKKIWAVISKPSAHTAFGVLVLGGFVAGIIFWGSFNTAMEYTNTEKFCIGCHEMYENPYTEGLETVHWSNRSGVRAICSDCHVPHDWTHKIARKMQASKEVWGAIFGTINTPEKYEAKRLEMASREWARFDANGSLECRNCHSYKSMNYEKMSEKGRLHMTRAAERDQSCIDCHKGIAHKLPQNLEMDNSAFAELEQAAGTRSFDEGEAYYTLRKLQVYADEALQQRAGQLNPVTMVKVLAVEDDRLQVEVNGWRKTKGFGRVINEDFGMNIVSGALNKETAQKGAGVEGFEKKVDDLTGLEWQRVNITLWMKPEGLAESVEPLWEYARTTYRSSCSVCHTQPAENHFDTNSWPGQFNGMLAFVNMDSDTQSLVLKYLQKHSSDFDKTGH